MFALADSGIFHILGKDSNLWNHFHINLWSYQFWQSTFPTMMIAHFFLYIQTKKILLFHRYEDEINKRNECENNFVLLKKVCADFLVNAWSWNYN